MPLFDRNDLARRGFTGFVTVSTVDRNAMSIPEASGVYVPVRASDDPPTFLERSGGGWWKRRDPTVPLERLRAEWVDTSQTLYIGKAESLRSRVSLLVRFSRGEPCMHWGGRLLWQIERYEEPLIAWRREEHFAASEADLIAEFEFAFGRLPFANLRRGDRHPARQALEP